MPNELEIIAQEEVYPQRYFGRKFPGEWPSERHHAICLNEAKKIYDSRQVIEVPTEEAKKPQKRRVARTVDELD